jgi:hypothetical protein
MKNNCVKQGGRQMTGEKLVPLHDYKFYHLAALGAVVTAYCILLPLQLITGSWYWLSVLIKLLLFTANW